MFLSSNRKYSVLRKTIHLNIPYYVKDRFETEYQGSLARLENAVEEEYIAVMKQSCYRERSYRKSSSPHSSVVIFVLNFPSFSSNRRSNDGSSA